MAESTRASMAAEENEKKTSTSPPDKKALESGKYNFYDYFEKHPQHIPDLLKHSIGGTFLNTIPGWIHLENDNEDGSPDIQALIIDELLHFIVENNLPPVEVIEQQITVLAEIAEKQQQVKNTLARHKDLPEEITILFGFYLVKKITERPEMRPSEILDTINEMTAEVRRKLAEWQWPNRRDPQISDQAALSYLAGNIIRKLDLRESELQFNGKSHIRSLRPGEYDSEEIDNTYPDSPNALRKIQGS